MWGKMEKHSNMNQDFRCATCRGEGMYLRYYPERRTSDAAFCDCPEGQRRKSAWILAGEIVQEEARKDQARRFHKMKRRDYKAEAGGERMPGDDEGVPF